MTARDSLVVQLAYPGIEDLVDISRVAAVDARIETLLCPYMDSTELRTAKRLDPWSEATPHRCRHRYSDQSYGDNSSLDLAG
jgi:hypothetical protein